jgi:hypothetical protein
VHIRFVLYKIFINSLLTTCETEKLGARIGSIFCGVPTVADDVTLVSFDPFELQTMLDTQMSHANKLRYIIFVVLDSLSE